VTGVQTCALPISSSATAVPTSFEDARRAPDPLARLMAHTLAWLTPQARAVAGAFSPVDRRLTAFATAPLVVKLDSPRLRLQLGDAHAAYVRAYRAVDPFAPRRWAAGGETVVSARDVGGYAAFARSRYADFLSSHGLGAQASIFLRENGRIAATVVLLRAAGEPDFAKWELLQLRRAQPFLELAYALARRQPALEYDGAFSGLGLTARELHVARLLAAGATNAEIGRALCISVTTVKSHVTHLLAKLGARSRTELVARLPPAAGAGAVEL
jgi:DNA-binding CsgD family transcriptional regulator